MQAALATVSRITSGETTGKLFVFGVLFVAAMTAYRLLPAGGFVPRAIASVVYVVNPFVYGRLHYGQLFLLAGYAALPWVALGLRRLFLKPDLATALLAAASVVLLGIASLHLLLVAGLIGATLLVTHTAAAKRRLVYMKRIAPALGLTVGVSLAASSYWVIPLLRGSGPEGSLLAGIGAEQLHTFAAVPDPNLGLLPNLIGLYGFWAENTGLFASMKGFVRFWPVVLMALLLVGSMGAIATVRQSRSEARPWVAALLLAAVIALVLEMGVSHPLTAGMVTWLDAHIGVYGGMRDAAKWAALLALVYSQLVGLGAAAILEWLRKAMRGAAKTEWVIGVATGLLLALPLYYGNGLLFGMHGEIKPSQYPPGWYAADRALAADSHPGRTLFLPWHEYMAYSFVRNQNRVVASPAPTFFSTPVVVSTNPEVPGVAPPTNPDQVAISELVKRGAQGNWAQTLNGLGIKYLLLARDGDWKSYGYLDDQVGLTKVGDFGSIVLYRSSLAT
ncbi:MAG TPA: hypothetical protein VGU71_16010 [Candidatus Dormibacteraeota bacterium]|nr:hypothetical protein [Candidatus Dormibacteraeota bacterium]